MKLARKIAIAVTPLGALLAVTAGEAGAPAPLTAQAIEAREHQDSIAQMRPPRVTRPVIAIVGDNAGTETTDFLVPYGILKRSGVADVYALATEDRPLKLMPALTVQADATIAGFDRDHPDGADYVIVPALHHEASPAVVAWLKHQRARGAMIVGICSGVKTLAAAGLLAGRRATGHWYDRDGLEETSPTMTWVSQRRYVVDGPIVTTTGVSASVPVSLALVEAIGGRMRAAALAEALGVTHWDARHDSRYASRRKLQALAALNMLRFWDRDRLTIPVSPGVDEVSLALAADAWSRTYRSSVRTVAARGDAVRTKAGLVLLPDERGSAAASAAARSATLVSGRVLPAALADIRRRYGERTATLVAMQLEYGE